MKNGDFVKIDFTGILTESNTVFDTTDEKKAKDNNVFDPKTEYQPKTVCVGEGHILSGLDNALEQHKVGDSFEVTLQPEDAFGKKSAKLIQLISTSKFKSQGMMPQPGMTVNVDNMAGVVKTVSGGRTLVDFNHPLSGKEVKYEIKILEQIEDKLVQCQEVLHLLLGLKGAKTEFVDEKKEKVKLSLPQMVPEPLQKAVSDKIKALVNVEIEFVIGKE